MKPQLLEPPGADPHAGWCGRGGTYWFPPIPIPGRCRLWRPGRCAAHRAAARLAPFGLLATPAEPALTHSRPLPACIAPLAGLARWIRMRGFTWPAPTDFRGRENRAGHPHRGGDTSQCGGGLKGSWPPGRLHRARAFAAYPRRRAGCGIPRSLARADQASPLIPICCQPF